MLISEQLDKLLIVDLHIIFGKEVPDVHFMVVIETFKIIVELYFAC